jgi:hypothetical protein
MGVGAAGAGERPVNVTTALSLKLVLLGAIAFLGGWRLALLMTLLDVAAIGSIVVFYWRYR